MDFPVRLLVLCLEVPRFQGVLVAGIIHDDLRLFLETNCPKSTKKQKSILGVGDAKIAGTITEEMGINCMHTDVVPEIIRGKLFLG